MTADVPTIRPYATRDEWRRDFHDGVALLDEEPAFDAPDVWEMLRREDGQRKGWVKGGEVSPEFAAEVVATWEPMWGPLLAHNTRTGEVVYGAGVQS